MTLANRLTLSRFVLAFVGMVALLLNMPYTMTVATGCFVVAALTDYLDGHLARSRGEITDFGKFMDSLADKILVIPYLIILTTYGMYPVWLMIAMIVRDLLNDGLRSFLASKHVMMSANFPSKLKATLQMVAIGGLLIVMTISADWGVWYTWFEQLHHTSIALMVGALVFGCVGTGQYLKAHGRVLFQDT